MTGPGRVAALALGSNLGDRIGRLRAAVEALGRAEGLRVDRASSVYQTAPVGPSGQPPYLNAVLLVSTGLSARGLIEVTQRIEASNGRIRVEHWGPRTLDIDVLTLGELISDDPVVVLPHPLAHTRAFVLVPWLEVDPQASIPGHGRVADLLAGLPTADVSAVRASRIAPGLVQARS